MKKQSLIVSMITLLVLGTLPAFGMECEVPPFVNQAVEPNILILFDTSGSMGNIIWIDSYDRGVDHSQWRLPVFGDRIIFAKEEGTCYIDHNRVTYDSSVGQVKLKYKKVPAASMDLCSGDSYYTQWSETDNSLPYFYFDRQMGKFMTRSQYYDVVDDDGDGDDEDDDGEDESGTYIKIFLPPGTTTTT